MRFFQLRAIVASAIMCARGRAALAQQPPKPTPEQARALLQARPELVQQLRQRLVQSGMTSEQIHARLRAEGYPEDLLDAYLPGATRRSDGAHRTSCIAPCRSSASPTAPTWRSCARSSPTRFRARLAIRSCVCAIPSRRETRCSSCRVALSCARTSRTRWFARTAGSTSSASRCSAPRAVAFSPT